jgi:hypothetical protein
MENVRFTMQDMINFSSIFADEGNDVTEEMVEEFFSQS